MDESVPFEVFRRCKCLGTDVTDVILWDVTMAGAPVGLEAFSCLKDLRTVTACECLWARYVCLLEVCIQVALHNKGLTTGTALEVLLVTVHRLTVLLQGIFAFERYATDVTGELPTITVFDHVSLERALAGTYLVTRGAPKHFDVGIAVHCFMKLSMHPQAGLPPKLAITDVAGERWLATHLAAMLVHHVLA